MELQTLYKKTKTGAIQKWTVTTDGADIITVFGQVGGTWQQTTKRAKGKSIGKKNETSPEEQANKQAKSMWTKRSKEGYFQSEEEARKNLVLLPMKVADLKDKKPEQQKEIIKKNTGYQPKMDGVRCFAVRDENGVRLLSRSGREYNVRHIAKAVKNTTVPGWDLDGEIYIHGLLRQDIQSLVTKHYEKPHPEIGYCSADLEFWVYDNLDTKRMDMVFEEREALLKRNTAELESSGSICVVPTIWKSNTSLEKLEKIHRGFVERGFEGTILRKPEGKYELAHRSNDVFKYKDMKDDEFEIVGFEQGEGRYEGCVKWVCRLPNGDTVDVNPKGSLPQKRRWYETGENYIGRMLTVQFQGWTKGGSLDFPVGLGIRLTEDID